MSDDHRERVESLGFDQVLQRLRQVIGQLETGNLSLEESLRAYEEGVGLARRGHTQLDSAEKRVELLVRDRRDGSLVEVPFDAGPLDAGTPHDTSAEGTDDTDAPDDETDDETGLPPDDDL